MRSSSFARSSSVDHSPIRVLCAQIGILGNSNAKRTGRRSSAAGAVIVRPMRLPLPSESVNRYQYTRAGVRPPTRTRQVQSDSAETATVCVATTRRNCGSRETSTVRFRAGVGIGCRRVHNNTLVLSGSPEATPSGKRSRRSRQCTAEAFGNGTLHAADAPNIAAR